MNKIKQETFTAWKNESINQNKDFIKSFKGKRLQVVVLCHDEDKDKSVLESVNTCILNASRPQHLLAVKSRSMVERIVRIEGNSNNSAVRFVDDDKTEASDFCEECRIPSTNDSKDIITGVVPVSISTKNRAPSTYPVCIEGKVVVIWSESAAQNDLAVKYELDIPADKT